MQSHLAKRHRTTLLFAGFFAAAFLATSATVLANNQWNCWHWAKSTIAVNTAAGGTWGTIISSEFGEWDAGTCLTFTDGIEITGDAQFFGITGWLGYAQILEYDAGACTILQAEAQMNQSYLDDPTYGYTEEWDRHVTCQEIGHAGGLDHEKGPRKQTCMNDQFGPFPDFRKHDADTIKKITVACPVDGGDTGAGGEKEKGKKKCNDGIDNDGDGDIDAADSDCQ